MYDDNRARHPGSIDRRAGEGEVFVVIGLQADSTDGMGGVQPGEHVIITDGGVENLCQIDAPDADGEETVVYTASCAVPVASSTFIFRMSSDKCVDGCESIDHQMTIDRPLLHRGVQVGHARIPRRHGGQSSNATAARPF